MIKVMVVEDEPPILRNICERITSLNPLFVVVTTAENGKEAIEKLNYKNDIDIIFVDMNLPILNGLEVLKFINENKLSIVSVVLSGYQDFHYVNHAYQQHIFDYLLKPISDDALNKLLDKVVLHLKKETFKKDGALLAKALKNNFDNYNLTTNSKYIMTLITFGNIEASNLLQGDEFWSTIEEQTIEDTLKQFFQEGSYWVIEGRHSWEKLVFIKEDMCFDIMFMNRVFKSLCSFEKRLTFTVKKDLVNCNHIYSLYYQMKKYTELNQIFCRSALLFFQEDVINTNEQEIDPQTEKALCKCQGNPEAQNVINECFKLIDLFYDKPTKRIYVIQAIKYFFMKLLSSFPCNRTYLQIEDEIHFALLQYDNVEEIKKELSFIINTIFGKIYIKRGDKQRISSELKEFIDKNFFHELNITSLAEQFGFVPSYLSLIFREFYEISLLDYIIALKMEESKKLLDNNVKIKDVAEQVGYKDASYFSKVFKKEIGISPKEYSIRKNHGYSR